MKILIVGDGKVGYALAEQLSTENHDVTVVDNSAKALTKALQSLDVLCVRGSASSKQTLLEAGVDKADLVIAVTSSDEINMVCALLAHKLGNARIIARIRNPEYTDSEDFIKDALGIDLCINPELAAAGEIARLLRFPSAHSIEIFARGRVEMVEFPLTAQSPVVGKELSELLPKLPIPVLISLVQRGEETFTPHGGTVLRAGDHIYVIGTPPQNTQFARYLGFIQKKIKNVMIVGGSRIAVYLAQGLLRYGMRPHIIERDEARSRELCELLPKALIVCGDGTDYELLEQESLREMDAFIALTDRDEENIIAGLHAKECVDKVVVKITRDYFARLAEGLSTINPKRLTAERIVRYVRAVVNSEGSFVEQLYRVAGGRAEALQFTAGREAQVVGIPLRDLALRPGILIGALIHDGVVVIPHGEDRIEQGDTVIILTTGDRVFLDINDILQEG